MRAAVKKLVDQKKLRIFTEQPLMVVPEAAMTKSASAILEAVDRFHRDNPLLPGIPKQELRGRVGKPRLELFEAALGDLVKRRAVGASGDLVQRAGREIALSADEARAKEMIEGEFERAGLTVPSVTAVLGKLPVETARAQKILQILLREKVLVKVADDLVFHREALAQLRGLLAKYSKEKGNRLPITAFKELAGNQPQIRHSAAGAPGPRARDAACRGRACVTVSVDEDLGRPGEALAGRQVWGAWRDQPGAKGGFDVR